MVGNQHKRANRLRRKFHCERCLIYCSWPRDRAYKLRGQKIDPPSCKGKGHKEVNSNILTTLVDFPRWLCREENCHKTEGIRDDMKERISSHLKEFFNSKGGFEVKWYDLTKRILVDFTVEIDNED